jgi:hypothetical protein
MFRIIAENQNQILVEGFKKINTFTSEHVIFYMNEISLELCGSNFFIDELGDGYMKICGDISEIKYTDKKII